MLFHLVNDIYAVHDLPVAYIEKLNAIAIADIHLGFEEDMASKGVYLPRIQLKKAIEIVEKAQSITKALNLIIVGDVKHHFEKLGKRESKDLKEFFNHISRRFEDIVLIRGNHDTFIYSLAKRFNIDVYDRMLFKDTLFIHGHRDLEDGIRFKTIVMGHEHPSISLKDPVTGYGIKIPCFLIVPLKNGGKAVILPAAGIYQSGTPISISKESFLSPIIRGSGLLEEAKPYAIIENEGVYELPKLSSITDLLKLF